MIEWPTLYDWQQDWNNPSLEAIAKRRQFYERTPFIERAMLARAISDVRSGQERLISHYASGYSQELSRDSSVGSTPYIDRLLQIAEKRLHTEHEKDPVWFEAISLVDQALGVTRIELDESMERTGSTMDRLVDLLSRSLFQDGYEAVDVCVYHDPHHAHVVPQDHVGINQRLDRPGTNERVTRLRCRRIHGGGIAYLHHRLKDPYRTWLKIQRQIIDGTSHELFDVSDRVGLMLIVPSMQEVFRVGHQVLELLVQDGGNIIVPLEANYEVEHPLDMHNVDSSMDCKLAKASVFWDDLEIELQFLTFADYFSSRWVLSDVNHELYKLKQAIRYFFPLLWPTEHYDVDWESSRVQRILRRWKIAQLGWAVKGEEGHRTETGGLYT